jgi:nicotinate-nucleotide adenylyltransferase
MVLIPIHMDVPKLRWLVRAGDGRVAPAAVPMRLGVLSGTFNPPTRAHLLLAEAAARQLELHEVVFVIPEILPHKTELEAALADREQMLRRAVQGKPRFSAGVSSHGMLVDIHRALAPLYPAATRTFFLLGRDAAERILLRWPYADRKAALEEMFARFDVVVADRGGHFEIAPDDFAAQYGERIHRLAVPPEWALVSATRVRVRVARGEPLDDVVVPEVAAYIAARGLYAGARAES